jgi:hypothetical protein
MKNQTSKVFNRSMCCTTLQVLSRRGFMITIHRVHILRGSNVCHQRMKALFFEIQIENVVDLSFFRDFGKVLNQL